MHNKLKKKKKYLKSLGFKKKSFDDNSDHWFVKKIKKTFLLDYCEINVQEFKGNIYLSVDCIDKEGNNGYYVTVYMKKFKKKRLKKILNLLNE